MVHRIEVGLKKESALAKKIQRILGFDVSEAYSLQVYSLDFKATLKELKQLADGPFSDKVIESASVDVPWVEKHAFEFDFLIEKSFLPGVTDAVGKSARQAAVMKLQRSLDDQEKIYSSSQYLFRGRLTQKQAEAIATGILGNLLIERFDYLSGQEFKNGKRIPPKVPKVVGRHKPRVETFDLQSFSEGQLRFLNEERQLALSLDELKTIQGYYTDSNVLTERKKVGLVQATDAEMEVFAQTWSEHCKHKEFNAIIEYVDDESGEKKTIDGLFPTFIAGATQKVASRCPWLVKVFKDNAGIVKFNKDYYFAFKVETHNSPSALDPYGGALTGIVGNNRDIAGVGRGGADLWFNQFYYCLGDPFFQGSLPPKTLHPRQIFEGVVAGVRDGGNKCGVPTINGGVSFDPRFVAKPLVFCGTGGLVKAKIAGKDSAQKIIWAGDAAIMVGGRIGKDGIHGATMSSEERKENTPATAVQIGDPLVQKVMLDFLCEARDKGWIEGITDNGAGGLSSSFGEMALQSGGVHIDIARAPLKYHGLQPWEILVSESQERMSVAVAKEHVDDFLRLAREREVEATVLGQFTNDGFFRVDYNAVPVVLLYLDFLHHGVPRKRLHAEWKKPDINEDIFEKPLLEHTFPKVIGMLDLCSKEWVFRQKDNNVKGGTLLPPIVGVHGEVNGQASLIKPIHLDSYEAVACAQGTFPKYADIDTYTAAQCAFNTSVGKIIAIGGQLPSAEVFWSVCDNFCVPDSIYSEKNPDGKYKLAQLVRLTKGAHDYAVAMGIPFTSGKDSMKNDLIYEEIGVTKRISVPPTLLISAVAKIQDYRKTVSMDLKRNGDAVYVLGETKEELAGSQYLEALEKKSNKLPLVHAKDSLRVFSSLSKAISKGLVQSAYYVSLGGLALAFAEKMLAGDLGLHVDLKKIPRAGVNRDDVLLFSETQNRFVVTISPDKEKEFEAVLCNVAFAKVGQVTEKTLLRLDSLETKNRIFSLDAIRKAYIKPLQLDLPVVPE